MPRRSPSRTRRRGLRSVSRRLPSDGRRLKRVVPTPPGSGLCAFSRCPGSTGRCGLTYAGYADSNEHLCSQVARRCISAGYDAQRGRRDQPFFGGPQKVSRRRSDRRWHSGPPGMESRRGRVNQNRNARVMPAFRFSLTAAARPPTRQRGGSPI
jgi:hypothetical protein